MSGARFQVDGPAAAATTGDAPAQATGGLAPAPNPGRMRMVVTGSGEHIFVADREPAAAVAAPAPEQRSDELQEIVGEVPGALLRWGISAVFGVLALLFVLAFIVRYPATVSGRAVLTAANPPVRVAPRSPGEIGRVLVRDGQTVERGALLAVLRNPADPGDVAALSARLDRFEPALRTSAPDDGAWAPLLRLGDVQPAYAAFLLALSQHRALGADPYFTAKAATLQAQMAEHRELDRTLGEGLRLAQSGLGVAQRELERSRELARRELLAPADAEKAQSLYLQAQQAAADRRNALIANQVQLSTFQGALLDLDRERRDRALQVAMARVSAFDALREALRRWELDYVLKAPVAGRLSFVHPLTEGQIVAAAEPLVAVVPAGPPNAATVMLANAGAGRVRPGQRVVMRLDAFPAGEFGALEGRVNRVSLVADRAQGDGNKEPLYMVAVDFPHGLVTTYGRRLMPRQELQGTADVITDDLRVIDRLLYQFRSLASRNRPADEAPGVAQR
jgi:HlyD family secretion protein